MKILGWIAVGGIGVGMVATGLVNLVNAADGRPSGFNMGGRSCDDAKVAKASGPERRLAWDGGDRVGISLPAIVTYRRGEGDEVIVRGEPEVIRYVILHNGTISLACDRDDRFHINFSGRDSNSEITITLPGREFREVNVSGSGRLTMSNLDQTELQLRVSGSGSMQATGKVDRLSTSVSGSGRVTLGELTSKDLDVKISGSGRIEGKGTSDRVDVDISGSGRAALAELATTAIDISVSGSGGVEAAPRDKADVSISGSGRVTMLTRPPQLNTNVRGSGRVDYAPRSEKP